MGNIIRPQETWKKEIKRAKTALAPDDTIPYERPIVEAIDKLLEMAKKRGYPTHVESETDWTLLEHIVKMWQALYPEQAEEFWKHQQWNKTNQLTDYASAKGESGAEVRHLLEIPTKLWEMIRAVFPEQKAQDKEFALKFGRRLPGFRWADKQ